MTKTLIVHGIDGSPAPHWQHWWAATEAGAVTVDLPDPARPDPLLWEIELAGMILRHPDSILVGHSLGAVLIARLLATWPGLRVRAALLVAPAETEQVARISQFGKIPTVHFGIPTTIVASRNDPWMTFARSSDLAKAWGSDLIDMGFAGHINVASGFGPWDYGKALRDDLICRGSPAIHSPHIEMRIA